MKNQKGFSAVEGLLVVLILVVVGFAGYYVVSNNSDDSDQDSTSQINNEKSGDSSEETEQSEETGSLPVEPEEEVKEDYSGLYTSGYRNEDSRVLLDFYIEEGFDSYWVEYGQTPDSLSEKTASKSDGLGYSFDAGYGGFTAVIDTSSLPAGDNIYFYRIAAIKSGVTHYTGIASFNYK